ncbi:YciI family protein [Streptomyces sp. NPDC012474]|uniref:YciI family protein n=1 Tax=Streptomyces sp. NPDC012474 TaxID=3364836 RepID=UPI0036EFE296
MFVPELTCTAPLEAVDAARKEHVDRLDRRGGLPRLRAQDPRDGGVIIAVAGDRARIEEVTAEGPFVTAGVCAYRVTEFTATKTAPAPEAYRETL